jgi:hypothetical protein
MGMVQLYDNMFDLAQSNQDPDLPVISDGALDELRSGFV